MPITSNNTAVMAQRQAFNGKGLTFVEVIFDAEIASTATDPSTKDSVFDLVSKVVGKNGNLLAQNYALGCKATERDNAEAAGITEDELIDVYQFIVEGTPGQFDAGNAVPYSAIDPSSTNASDPGVIANAEADLELDILAAFDDADSAGGIHVNIRYLPADGVTAAGSVTVYGTFNPRVNG
jgi:hypothetical protein